MEREANGKFKVVVPLLLLDKPNPRLAEFIGIMLGDGNFYFDGKIGMIRIIGHKYDDRDYLLNYVKPLFKNLFNSDMSIQIPKDGKKALRLYKARKSLTYTLRHYGLIAGNKRKNNVGIPDWIFDKKEYIQACLRGLIDTDGSIYPKTKNHKTPTIWFNSAIPRLRNDFKKSLAILNYKVSKWTEKHSKSSYGEGVYQCSMGDRENVLRYHREIGFGNPKHEKRFRKFCKAPIV